MMTTLFTRPKTLSLLVCVLTLFLSACDTSSENIEIGEPVVEAYLVAGEPMPTIRLTRTTDISTGFGAAGAAIRDASIRVTLEGEGQEPDIVYDFRATGDAPGVYEPLALSPILPGRTYHFSASITSESETLSASTIVPTAFNIVRVKADTVVYQGDIQYSVDITESGTPNREPIYVQSIRALNVDPCALTPLYLEDAYNLSPDDDFDCTTLEPGFLDEYLVVASPPLNAQSFEVNPDGSTIIPLPWFGVVFYGEALVGTASIDDSLYDFMRFQAVQQDGGSLSPGEIPNILDHVDGGRGLFSSMAKVESLMTVTRD